ncbi:MAG: site-2 protease family protein, partial [Oscillospiraceae bacterium]
MTLQISSIKIKISFYFFLIMALLSMFQSNKTIIASLFFVVLHEVSHIIAMIINGEKVNCITLLPFGVKIVKNDSVKYGYWSEFFIYSAGLITNFTLFIIFLFLFLNYNKDIFLLISFINFYLFLFNILPIKVLDGGNILRIILINRVGLYKGEKIAFYISLIISILILILGFY